MLSNDEIKLLNLNFKDFPLMAAASATIKGCSTCPHKQVNKHVVLKTALIRLKDKPLFRLLIKKNFKLPVVLGGFTFHE